MKLWLFTFCDPQSNTALVVVAAEDKPQACNILTADLGLSIDLGVKSSSRIIASFHGEDVKRTDPGIIYIKQRDKVS